jgi:hypothetical protein
MSHGAQLWFPCNSFELPPKHYTTSQLHCRLRPKSSTHELPGHLTSKADGGGGKLKW